jgi:hypothetical protein
MLSLNYGRATIVRVIAALGASIAVAIQTAAPAAAASVRGRTPVGHRSIDSRFQRAITTGSMQLVYISQRQFGTVLAYPAAASTPPMSSVETISGLTAPTGLAVDAHGNLYVAEQTLSDIKVFRPGSLTPFKTLVAPPGTGGYYGVAVDGQGTVYAATLNGGGIQVYANGATTPSYALTDPSIKDALEIAVDSVGNVFVSYNTGVGAAFGVFPASTSLGAAFNVRFFHQMSINTNAATPAFSMVVDKNGDLVVSDLADVVSVYRPASQSPALKLPLNLGQYLYIGLTGSNNRHLFVAGQNAASILRYSFPGVVLEQTIPLPGTLETGGIAVSPPAPVGAY